MPEIQHRIYRECQCKTELPHKLHNQDNSSSFNTTRISGIQFKRHKNPLDIKIKRTNLYEKAFFAAYVFFEYLYKPIALT
jgi:hypothetical protein